MAIFKYAKVLVLAPAIGSALIGIAGLVFGVVLIVGHEHPGNLLAGHNSAPISVKPADSHTHPSPVSAKRASAAMSTTQLQIATQSSTAGEYSRTHPIGNRIANTPEKQAKAHLNFEKPIESSALSFLKDYANRAADDVDAKRQVKTLVSMVAPYTPFHFGVDFPLPQVVSTLLLNEPQPIEIRDGRYAMMSGIRNAIHKRAGFLWVDMREGIALGGIFFDPGNGEPSPTLTIFSKQMNRRSVSMSQLPRAFAEDLSRWAAKAAIPPVTTRYFIGASGEKFVLTHDENYCVRSVEVTAPSPKGTCDAMNAQAALIDTAATRFMEQTHNASNATMRMIASSGQVE